MEYLLFISELLHYMRQNKSHDTNKITKKTTFKKTSTNVCRFLRQDSFNVWNINVLLFSTTYSITVCCTRVKISLIFFFPAHLLTVRLEPVIIG